MRRIVASAIGMLLFPAPALACSCTWSVMHLLSPEMRALAETQLRESAESVRYVVEGEVTADSTTTVCRQGRSNASHATHQTLRIDRVLRGQVPAIIQLRTADVTPSAQGCGVSANSCDVTLAVGSRGVWPLEKRDGEWRLVGFCQFDAFRRRFAETGGEGEVSEAS